MTSYAYAELLRPVPKVHAIVYDTILVLAGSAILALSAQLSFYFPFSPVPITGQTFAVLFLGAVLGSYRGTLAVLAYLVEAAMGLPVLAGGMAGIAYMVGPTGGYLTGFIAAAFIAGFLAERGWDRNVGTALLAMVLGDAALFICGMFWLSVYIGWEKAIYAGLLPFIIGECLKLAAASLILPSGWKLISRRN